MGDVGVGGWMWVRAVMDGGCGCMAVNKG